MTVNIHKNLSKKRILILKPSSFGDIIHAMIVVQSIKKQLPAVRITWVIRDIFSGILSAWGVIDRLIIFKRGAGFFTFVKLLKEIRAEEYDYVLDMQGLLRTGVMTFFAKSRLKIGRFDAREGSSLFYNRITDKPKHVRIPHAVDILAEFLGVLGLKKDLQFEFITFFNAPGFPQHIFLRDMDFIRNYPSKSYILFFPDSRRPEKIWPFFKELTEKMLELPIGESIIWLGQSDLMLEKSYAPSRFLNLMNKTTIADLIYLIAHAKMVVVNDSGPMHLAAALGIPTIALFGPTDPMKYGPFPLNSPLHVILKAPGDDLSLLSPEVVLENLQSRLIK